MTLPNRASDAGPDERTKPMNRQSMYSLLVDDLLEESRSLDRLYRDDREAEKRERLAAIDRAIEILTKMREVA